MIVTEQETELYKKAYGHLKTNEVELKPHSLKKPDGTVSTFKLKFINDALKDANTLLGEECRPLNVFEEFNDEHIATYSDVVLVLNHYLAALDSWRAKRLIKVGYNSYDWNFGDMEEYSTDDDYSPLIEVSDSLLNKLLEEE